MVNRKLLMNGLIRAGFTLSRALFRKKCGGLSTGTVDSIFLEKYSGDLFLVIIDHRLCVSYQFSSKTGDLFCKISKNTYLYLALEQCCQLAKFK